MTWQYILHRVNKINDLNKLKNHWGAEIDLRSNVLKTGNIHLSHDPWSIGDDFEDWINIYSNCNILGPLILNTKEDGLETHIIKTLNKYNIENWFFLDTAMPTLIKFATERSESRFALRLSNYEPIDTLKPLIGKVQWVWVDCFGGIPLNVEIIRQAAQHFKICLVSPELVGKNISEINHFMDIAQHAHSICTKDPSFWSKNKYKNDIK